MVGAACTCGAGARRGRAARRRTGAGWARRGAAAAGAGRGAEAPGRARPPARAGRSRARRRLRLLRRGAALLLGDLAAEVLQQRVEAAVEALADGGEPPDVLQVEVAQHHGALGGELRAVEGVPGDLLAARDDAEVAGADLRHLAGAVDASR